MDLGLELHTPDAQGRVDNHHNTRAYKKAARAKACAVSLHASCCHEGEDKEARTRPRRCAVTREDGVGPWEAGKAEGRQVGRLIKSKTTTPHTQVG